MEYRTYTEAGPSIRIIAHLRFATSAHATHRRGIGSTDAARANRSSGTCKQESGHDGVDVSTAAVGVEEQRCRTRRSSCRRSAPSTTLRRGWSCPDGVVSRMAHRWLLWWASGNADAPDPFFSDSSEGRARSRSGVAVGSARTRATPPGAAVVCRDSDSHLRCGRPNSTSGGGGQRSHLASARLESNPWLRAGRWCPERWRLPAMRDPSHARRQMTAPSAERAMG
jgi:hypothetical protein